MRLLMGILAGAVVVMSASCRGDDKQVKKSAAVVVRDTTHRQRDTAESPGEILDDSVVRPAGRWVTDGNVLALLGIMNARTIAAADLELEGWHSEPTRAFAAMIAREHAELQHSADSLSERVHIAPVVPALGQSISTTMRGELDSMTQFRKTSLDRAFVRQQIESHEVMLEYAERLMAVAERPEVRAVAASMAGRLATHLQRARSLRAAVDAADSGASADSAVRRLVRKRP
ncbi:MAG TPA: DUF4142 domain-containing protein [Gemmatimonadaceae bacterium]|nr:DUF4142 domain-containing protein [Gemmatimonadaceae bacterium]